MSGEKEGEKSYSMVKNVFDKTPFVVFFFFFFKLRSGQTCLCTFPRILGCALIGKDLGGLCPAGLKQHIHALFDRCKD